MSLAKRPPLALDSLDERIVPAVVNLTSAGSAGTANGALFSQLNAGALPGATNTFLRLQEGSFLSSLLTPEEGYNTSARPLQFDATGNTSVTHSLLLKDLPLVTVGGLQYRELLLTVNQPQILANIDLEELRIFLSGNGMLSGYNTNTDRLAGLQASWNLDAGSNNTVRINDNLNRTSSADVRVLIPATAFGNSNPDTTFVYVYSKFSAFIGTTALSGAESWAVREIQVSPPPPPSPPVLGSLAGHAFRDMDPDGEGPLAPNGVYDAGEGLGGLTVTLSGLDANGQTIVFGFDVDGNPITEETVITGSDGSYSFGDLAEGTYSIAITNQTPLESQDAQLGTTSNVSTYGGDGGVGQSAFSSIALAPGETGDNFNFRMANVE